MAIVDRNAFGMYCLRKLGAPVIRINVSPDQIEDRIDEAIQVWHEKHYDATEKLWVAYKLTADDISSGQITIPSDIHIIDAMIPMSTIYNKNNSDGIFSYQYQFTMANLSPWQPLDMLNYYITMTHLGEMNDLINTTERFEYTKHKNKLIVYRGFSNMKVDDTMCFHAHKKILPDTDSAAWEDKWLKQYATALIKQQWGSNMKKHGEIQLLGGVTVNGQQIFDEATIELKELEEALTATYEEPVSFQLG